MAITKSDIKALEDIVNQRKFFIEGAELYGMKKILFEFLDLPSDLPQSFYLDHGVPLYDANRPLNKKVLDSRFPLILLTSQDQLDLYRPKIKDKPVLGIGALFPKYRKMAGLELATERRGTIVFPSHSTLQVDVIEGWSEYAQRLKELPEDFHPITVCLYWMDVLRGRQRIFERAGFDVTTMGHFSRQDFAHQFYSTARHFKYATSNEFGSYLPYCVEMGLPFFIYGDPFLNQLISKTAFYPDKPFTFSAEMGLSAYDHVRVLFALRDEKPSILANQKSFVDRILGMNLDADKQTIRAAILQSQKENYSNLLRTRLHKLIWDFIYLGPDAFVHQMEKRIKPFYIRQKI